MSKTKKFLFDTISKNVLKVLHSTGNFIATWWIIKKLGEHDYGIYRSATASILFLSIAGGGMISAAYALIVEAISKHDYDKANSIAWYSFKFLSKIAIFLLLLSYPISIVLAWLYKIPDSDFIKFSLTATFAACSLILGFFTMPFLWILQARQLEHVLNLVLIPFTLTLPFALILPLMWKNEPWAPALGFLAFVFTGNCICIAIPVLLNPWLLNKSSSQINKKEITRRTFYGLLEQISASLIAQALPWAITSTKGPATFGILAATMTFFAFFREMFSTMSLTLVAPIGSTFFTNTRIRFIQIWKEVIITVLFLGAIISTLLAVNNNKLITLWLGPEFALSFKENVLLSIALFFNIINFPTFASLYASGGLKRRSIIFFIESIITIIILWFSSYYFDLYFTLLIYAIIQIIFSATYYIAFKNFIKEKIDYNILFTVFKVLIIYSFILFIFFNNQSIGSDGIFQIGISFFIQLLLLTIIYWYLGLNKNHRKILISRIINLIRKN